MTRHENHSVEEIAGAGMRMRLVTCEVVDVSSVIYTVPV